MQILFAIESGIGGTRYLSSYYKHAHMLFISSIHIIAFCWSFSPLIFLGGTVLTFLKVQKVAPPPASVLLVATMLVPASLLLLLVKLARVHLVLMGVW